MNVRKLPVFNEFVKLNSLHVYNKQRSFKHINKLYYGVRPYCDCLKYTRHLSPMSVIWQLKYHLSKTCYLCRAKLEPKNGVKITLSFNSTNRCQTNTSQGAILIP